jgi:hypothetical protein
VDARFGKVDLKIEAAQSGQPDVKNQAAGDIRKLALQKFGSRTEHFDPQAHRPEKIPERLPHRFVIIDNVDDRLLRPRNIARRCRARAHGVLSS